MRGGDERAARGDAAFVADLGVALTRAYGGAEPLWQDRSVFDQLLRLLAPTPGSENVRQAVRLVSSPDAADRRRGRCTASLPASCRRPQELAVAFSGHASEELRACLVHELVLRGVAVAEEPGIARRATSPHRRYHPLGWLPLPLSGLEEGRICRATPSVGAATRCRTDRREAVRTGGPVGAGAVGGGGDHPEPAAAMSGAVASWPEEPNGLIAARVFGLAGPLEDGAVPAALLTLGLESLAGLGGRRRPCPSRPVRRGAGCVSCSPPRRREGRTTRVPTVPNGRLAAWKSLAAPAGAADGADAAEVAARVPECAWFGFDAATDWFER